MQPAREFRLSGGSERTDWVVGAYYLNIDTDSSNALKAPPNSIFGSLVGAVDDRWLLRPIPTTCLVSMSINCPTRSESLAACGSCAKDYRGNWGVAPQWAITVTYDVGMYIPNAAGAGDPLSIRMISPKLLDR